MEQTNCFINRLIILLVFAFSSALMFNAGQKHEKNKYIELNYCDCVKKTKIVVNRMYHLSDQAKQQKIYNCKCMTKI